MTTRERINTLYDGGHEPHMIAALLDLDVTDVAETLADPEFSPPEANGFFAVHWGLQSLSAPGSGSDLLMWAPGTSAAPGPWPTFWAPLGGLSLIPTTVAAGQGQGINWWAKTPTFSTGTLELATVLEVTNSDGTQKLAVNVGFTQVGSDLKWEPDMTGWTVVEKIGEDLSIAEGGKSIDSAAGGQFMASLLGDAVTTGLVA